MNDPQLSVESLSVSYLHKEQPLRVLTDVSFQVPPGGAYGLVGESGCGKTTLALTIMRYLPGNAIVESGSIRMASTNVLELSEQELTSWRGRRMSMVYQDPDGALNPSMRVGDQVGEMFRRHRGSSRRESRERAGDMLSRVAMPDPLSMMRRYPHQLSGGQKQRVVISMALALDPSLLILDEPTTGLDATVEAEVLDLIARLRTEFDTSLLFISHNLALVSSMCERVGVLYSGRLVEEGDAASVFQDPQHPYTSALMRCIPHFGARKDTRRLVSIPGALPPLGTIMPGCTFEPRCPIATEECRIAEPELFDVAAGHRARCYHHDEVEGIADARSTPEPSVTESSGAPLLELIDLRKEYRGAAACDDVTLEVGHGEVFGLVGESGSGKSTLAKCVVGLLKATSGTMTLNGTSLPAAIGGRDRDVLRRLQLVFQHPDSTLNPTQTTRHILQRAISKLGGELAVDELADRVQLGSNHLGLRAGELSGGLRQRVAIGRAFAGKPELVVCDEPVSALDVSIQAAVLNLLIDLQREQGVSYIFISHDLAVVYYLADRIGVMYAGQIIEVGPAAEVFKAPHHPYTEALVSSIPSLRKDPSSRAQVRLRGQVPSITDPPSGCRFHTRCPRKVGDICETTVPPWQEGVNGHRLQCHIPVSQLVEIQQAVGVSDSEGASSVLTPPQREG